MMEVSLQEILDSREKRVQNQRILLKKYKKPLICFTMNIPGPEKNNREISIAFWAGNQILQSLLKESSTVYRELTYEKTGCEGYYVVDSPAMLLKQLAVTVEDTSPIGRLFDIDILDIDGRKLSRDELGLARRQCLLCGKDAVVCARSRAHGLPALQKKIDTLLQHSAREQLPERIGTLAWQALQQEFNTTPKPGLVDRNNSGAHKDMDILHFSKSADALRPYFCRFTQEGFFTRDLEPTETFRRIRPIGKDAEAAMLAATGGVNTHKGAIFSMGLFCAAAGRLSPQQWTPEHLCRECAAMTAGVTAQDFAGVTVETAKTAGERLFATYGITGVRGQAEAGFPAVLNVGLPVLRQGLEKGLSFNDAGCAALLHLIAATDDTNLIHRSDRQMQLQIKAQLAELLAKDPYPALDTVRRLDREFIEKNLSPGGSADLLAATYFLQFING